ncbi:MAG: DUF3299 domain-containing protein [Polynucleobacter sp.]|jgi:hypothetical protein
MRRIFLRRLIQVLAGSALSSLAIPAIGSAYKEVEWDELMPEGWRKKVILELTRMRRYGSLTDGDPRADEAYARLKKTWDAAPPTKTYIGKPIRIAGYVVPLDAERMQSSEFLLVPYFGACVHSPPPPANQIILIKPPKGSRFRTMDAIWVEGILTEGKTSSEVGTSTYVLTADKITPYR